LLTQIGFTGNDKEEILVNEFQSSSQKNKATNKEILISMTSLKRKLDIKDEQVKEVKKENDKKVHFEDNQEEKAASPAKENDED